MRLPLYLILKSDMILPARINIFYSKAPIKPTRKIINISSKPLTERQITLLRSGLKFTPTPKPNIIELKSDTQEFTRKLRLIEFFTLKTLITPKK